MAAEGLITFDELGAKLATLEETHQTAQRELAALKGRAERLHALERDRDILLDSYSKLMPDVLDALEPEERHRVYKMLRLRVLAYLDGTLEVSGALSDKTIVCNSKTIRSRSPNTSGRRCRRSSRGGP